MYIGTSASQNYGLKFKHLIAKGSTEFSMLSASSRFVHVTRLRKLETFAFRVLLQNFLDWDKTTAFSEGFFSAI